MRVAALLMLALLAVACQPAVPDPSPAVEGDPQLVFVGTASGEAANGIHALRFDPATGALASLGQVAEVLNPSFLASSPDGGTLYAVSEAAPMGAVLAYAVDAATGTLTLRNQQASGGAHPAHVSVHPSGDWVFVANYSGGSVALLSTEKEGALRDGIEVLPHRGSGPNLERQEGPHAHFIHPGPDGRYLYAADLGTDRVWVYFLSEEKGSLTPVDSFVTDPGAGPRHLDFHPNGRYAYLVNELIGTVTALAIDAETGGLTALQTLSTLPTDFDGYNKSADIHVHPNGRWLYVSNRGDFDSLARFAIDPATGQLSPAGHHQAGIHWPRHFAFDPAGAFLLVANRRANEVRVFAVNPETGHLTPTEHRATMTEPTNVTFLVGSK